MSEKQGYLYAATGKKFTDEAAASVRSLRRFNSKIHATLITDKACTYAEFDNIIIVDFDSSDINWKKGLLYKALALQHSPYEKTFFADTPETVQLFKDWLAAYQEKFEIYPSDQTPFMEALLKNKVRLYVLLPFYNFREHFMVSLPPGRVKIIHGRPRDVVDLEKRINKNTGHRTWLPRREKIIFRQPKSLKRRLKNALPQGVISFYRSLKK